MRCGSSSTATAATRGRVAAQALTAATRFRRGHFSKAGSQRGVAAQALRRLPHGRVAAQAQTAATRFRPGHFSKAGYQHGVAGLVAAGVAAQLGKGAVCGRGAGGRCVRWGEGGGPQNRGEGGRWPLAGDIEFENSHKNIATIFAQEPAQNRLGPIRGRIRIARRRVVLIRRDPPRRLALDTAAAV